MSDKPATTSDVVIVVLMFSVFLIFLSAIIRRDSDRIDALEQQIQQLKK